MHRYLNLRYEGTDTAIFTESKGGEGDFWSDYASAFSGHYKREFGFDLSRDVIVDDYRVRCVVAGAALPAQTDVPHLGPPPKSCRVAKNRR